LVPAHIYDFHALRRKLKIGNGEGEDESVIIIREYDQDLSRFVMRDFASVLASLSLVMWMMMKS
jgi:hypothetical protein